MSFIQSLQDGYADHVEDIARGLEGLADAVRREGERAKLDDFGYVRAAGRVMNRINWGIPNLNVDDLYRRAVDIYEVAKVMESLDNEDSPE